MNIKLFFKAITRYIFGVVLVGILLFVPAGTFNYWNAWLFMRLLFIPMFIAGIILIFKNPTLLKSRLDVKEKEEEQKQVIIYSGFMFLFGFIIAGLNYRYSWIKIPNTVVITSSFLFIISYILYAEVLRENTYLSRTIEVQKKTKSCRYWIIWYSKTPNVLNNSHTIFNNAINTRLNYFIYYILNISIYYY